MNFFREPLDIFLQHITNLKGMMFHLETHLKKSAKIIEKNFEPHKQNLEPDYSIMDSGLIIGDLTSNNQDGLKNNFPTGYEYNVPLEQFEIKVNELFKSRSNEESCASI